MSLHQVIYTSCMRGIKGVNDGQQVFSYDSQFIDSDNDEVKSLYSYKPPELDPGVRMSEEIALTLPKSYIFRTLEDGRCTLSLSTYLGRDYMGSAGRFGNHLSHVIVGDKNDFNSYPCEYFGGSSLRDHMEFEEVNNPDPPAYLPIPILEKGYTVDVDTVLEFLSVGDRLDIYKNMLYAMLSFNREQKRVVICDDQENIIMWIAALEYALPLQTALKINFTTYEYDPALSASQLCGVVASGTRYNDESKRLHYVFDFFKNEYAEFDKDSDFYDFIDTAFSLSFDSIQDFHLFILNGFSYDSADENIYAAYALYSIMSDGVTGVNTNKLTSALSFAEKFASDDEKSAIVNNLISQYSELLSVDKAVFTSVLRYILAMKSKITQTSPNNVKQLVVDRILSDFSSATVHEESFSVFYQDIDKLCRQYDINLSTEIMTESNRTRLFSVVQGNPDPWKLAYIIRIISRFAKSKKIPIDELSPDRPFGKIYYELIQKVQSNDSSSISFLIECILDEFNDKCDFLVNMALNSEGMILDTKTANVTVPALWKYFIKTMSEKQTQNYDIAYKIFLEYDRNEQLYMLFKSELQVCNDAASCKTAFDRHYAYVIGESRSYSAKYKNDVIDLYYDALSRFDSKDTEVARRELFNIIVDAQLEPNFVDELIHNIVENIPLSSPNRANEQFIKNAFQYTYNLRQKSIKGKVLLLLIGMIMETISIKEQVEKKIEQLEVLTNRNPADLTSLSDTTLSNYYNWILPIVFKWCKSLNFLNRFFDLFEMSNVSKQRFILDLTDIYLRDSKENKDNTGFVYYFQFISENGTSAIRKEIGKSLCKLNKNKMMELDVAMRDCYIKDKQVLAHWEEVKEVAESTNPILNNIANLFRRKKKED